MQTGATKLRSSAPKAAIFAIAERRSKDVAAEAGPRRTRHTGFLRKYDKSDLSRLGRPDISSLPALGHYFDERGRIVTGSTAALTSAHLMKINMLPD
jgi:hypothetical protein